MKLGWSGFRSAFAFAIIAVTSEAEANSFGGGGGIWAVSCRAIPPVISRIRIVQRTRRRIRPPVRRRLYSIRVSPARAQRCRPCATDVSLRMFVAADYSRAVAKGLPTVRPWRLVAFFLARHPIDPRSACLHGQMEQSAWAPKGGGLSHQCRDGLEKRIGRFVEFANSLVKSARRAR